MSTGLLARLRDRLMAGYRVMGFCASVVTWVSAVVLGSLGGCASNDRSTDLSGRKIRVVTTTGMITDMVSRVGGDRLEVKGLMGAGVDPHLYKPSASDLEAMTGSDAIFFNGLHLEGKMADVFEGMSKKKRTVAVTKLLDPEKELRPAQPGFESTHDPHVWFDVRIWAKCVDAVRDALVEMDPKHAETYRTNARKYVDELTELDKYVRAQADKVPKDKRVLITSHDAFYYFGHAYGFEVKAVQGISTAAEASPKDVDELANFVTHRKVPVVFIESSVNPGTIEAVKAAVKKKGNGFEVHIGGELFSDALGDAGTPEGTYIGMVRHNIDTIVGALNK
ncbi:MAG: zinc ABC transporter substrate-binding protein [Gemmataceae bacterium]|nr:zinc ABC transporter substrate-binding protein [Gemmataceae bacterium]